MSAATDELPTCDSCGHTFLPVNWGSGAPVESLCLACYRR